VGDRFQVIPLIQYSENSSCVPNRFLIESRPCSIRGTPNQFDCHAKFIKWPPARGRA
jgi:hypothetical protein